MSKIKDAFKKGKAFIPFISAGDHGIETTERYIRIMVAAGADMVEIGIPFSDPTAEGPVIQEASTRALSTGVKINDIFDMVRRLRSGDDAVTAPLVFMTYLNPIYVFGREAFFKLCEETGIAGIIVPDMPYEEKGELAGIAHKYGVEVVSLIAPTSENRIEMIAKDAEGFVYCVSSLGVTGMRSRSRRILNPSSSRFASIRIFRLPSDSVFPRRSRRRLWHPFRTVLSWAPPSLRLLRTTENRPMRLCLSMSKK